jgi:uncharacterized BrkB/YihY/UPF0761 family membrane protein
METSFICALSALGGLVAGGVVGLAFGVLQRVAHDRYELRQQQGKLNSGWVVVPGSFTRVAFLMIALVLVQVCLPVLFLGNVRWFVSAGVVLGYGWTLFQHIRRRTVE